MAMVQLPLRVNRPRSVLVNLASLPFLPISRRMAEYKVAAGVGAVVPHNPFSFMAATISAHRIGSPLAWRTAAAASRQLIALGFFSFAGFFGALSLGALAGFGAFAAFAFFPPRF